MLAWPLQVLLQRLISSFTHQPISQGATSTMNKKLLTIIATGSLLTFAAATNASPLYLDQTDFSKTDITTPAPVPGSTEGHDYAPTQGVDVSFGQLSTMEDGFVRFEFLFKEAGATNDFFFDFVVGDTPIFSTSSTSAGTKSSSFAVTADTALPFQFCTTANEPRNGSKCVINDDVNSLVDQWDGNGFRSLGFMEEVPGYSWLAFFDDSGQDNDDDYDDMIVRITFDVLEPGTLALLGLGLIGFGLMRRLA